MNESKKNKYKNDDINTLEYIKKQVDRILKDKDYYIIPLDGIYFFTLSVQDHNNIKFGITFINIAVSKYNSNSNEYIKEYIEKIIIDHTEKMQSHINDLIDKLKEDTNG
ncbi:MAG: hypothetical protein HXL60_07555 [Solobacterium sp.]|nr:hypothetical protein [Solobacterium sp.]